MIYWPNIWTFQCWKEKSSKGWGVEQEREGFEQKVSYSVSGDLQIT